MLLDFALVGEEGKKGNYGLKQKQLDARFSKEHAEGSHIAKRIGEYNQSKIMLMIEMIRRVIKRKIHFDYVLATSHSFSHRRIPFSTMMTSCWHIIFPNSLRVK